MSAFVVVAAPLTLLVGGFELGAWFERAKAKREARHQSEQRLQKLMRDIWTLPPSPRNAPLKFTAGCDATAAALLIQDSSRGAPRGEE
jgi:hypothetical protein